MAVLTVNPVLVDIKEFTDNVIKEDIRHTVSGDGIFDDLMETATKHLLAQYEGNRIRAEQYADAYVQVYTATLQAAMQIWLQKPESMCRCELLHAQKLNTEADTLLKGAQKDNTEAQTQLLGAQKDNTEAQTQLLGAQRAHTEAQTLLTGAQKLNVEADTQLKGAQKLLADAQKALTTAQATHEPSKKLNTEADTALKNAQAQYIAKQKDAAAKDTELKEAQRQSEISKRDLYVRQIEGFDEDFKQKILKICLDSWAVGFSVAKDTIAPNANTIPAAMSRTFLDALLNQAIKTDIDINTYEKATRQKGQKNMT